MYYFITYDLPGGKGHTKFKSTMVDQGWEEMNATTILVKQVKNPKPGSKMSAGFAATARRRVEARLVKEIENAGKEAGVNRVTYCLERIEDEPELKVLDIKL